MNTTKTLLTPTPVRTGSPVSKGERQGVVTVIFDRLANVRWSDGTLTVEKKRDLTVVLDR